MKQKSGQNSHSVTAFLAFFFRCFVYSDLDSHEPYKRSYPTDSTQSLIDRSKLRFSCFSGEKFGTILSRRSRLSRTSRAPSRLIRPRSIDCDAGPQQPVKTFPVLGFEHRQKKVFSKGPASSGDLHPKRSPSLDFRDRGVSIRVTNAGQNKSFLGVASL